MAAPLWWQDAICYQIYPRSFADGNGDGIGDLPGIIDKLDYLAWLGVTALWISPFFPSPQFDCGYDISDYRGIEPEYGTMADFDRLLEAAHQRGIRILIDLVMNHTSDQHPYFQESRKGKDNPYRDWFIWREGVRGEDGTLQPPNNWESIFGGSAWEYDEVSGAFYYHYFFKQQPDLNYRNPAVRQWMFDNVRFWLDKGVDGFRLDALGAMYETETLPPAPQTPSGLDIWLEGLLGDSESPWALFETKMIHQDNLPEVYDLMRELRALADEYPDRVLLGETEKLAFYGNGEDTLHSVFNFTWTDIGALRVESMRRVLSERLPRIPAGAWDCNTLGNHDRLRSFDVFSDGLRNNERNLVALAAITFLRGTPVFYNGEEIGMSNLFMRDIADFRDNLGVWAYEMMVRNGLDPLEALEKADSIGRDKCRTPMQWRNAPNAGFSPEGVKTWLPVHPNYAEGVNVEDQQADAHSFLYAFREIITARQDHLALRRGDFELIYTESPVLLFWRRAAEQRCLVALNMSDQPLTLTLGEGAIRRLYSTNPDAPDVVRLGALSLMGYEIFVGEG